MSGTPAPPDDRAGGQPGIWMEGTASEQGRVYQAAGNQTINQTVLPEAVLRPVTEVAASPGLVNLPRHTRTFVGRGGELAALEAALQGGGEVVLTAVHGLGGVGKSTLVAHYALAQATGRRPDGRQAGGGLNPVWWITADSGQAVQTGLAGLAAALQPELATALPLEALAERATAWLAAHQGWLLVLDNVVDVADVRPLLERTLAGQVLVTSRLGEGWHRLDARVLRLDVLGEREALELLTRIVAPGLSHDGSEAGLDKDLPKGLDGAVELVRELGCLPLAIEQAGAYLHQTRLSPRAYLDLLVEHPAVMYDRTARGADAERTIARLWRVTLDRLADTPLAGQLLRIMAWYGAEPVPRTLLDGLDAKPPEVQHALGELAAYNMITLDQHAITVHRLVQAVARTPDHDDPRRRPADIDTALQQATSLLNAALPSQPPEHPNGWPAWRALLPHIGALADHAALETDTTNTAQLLNNTGLFLHNQGAVTSAISYFHRANLLYQQNFGFDHPGTLVLQNNLAYAYEVAGDLDRAIPLYEATLSDRERVLGVDHPRTLISRNNLGTAYLVAGDSERAIPLFKQTLAARESMLGLDHADTLISRNNLARAYQVAGDLQRAIPLYETTLVNSERVLGADHPDTLSSRSNLASAYVEAGELERAIPLYEAMLADSERVLGADHPSTLRARNNLAQAYVEEGDLERAIPLYEAMLADSERVLGADDPSTLRTRNNLAYVYQVAGELERAIPLYETTLVGSERVLGADHPDTLSSRNNLASAYQAAGELGRAIPLFEATLANCDRFLGSDHLLTQAVRGNLLRAMQRREG
ncbi:FxSxx-COOH system tetratricopeptide repeat protein [Nonomuraea jabiensis]|uniref:FxSxx-COOH system tetratricopeptide repeat protein n=1 Tax=Nonomuraea jabiensis TaxID=882448 RepID=UPI0036D1FA24